jgi:hypothetical protein
MSAMWREGGDGQWEMADGDAQGAAHRIAIITLTVLSSCDTLLGDEVVL